MATSTAELSPSVLAEMFAEVEKKDMRVVEVRVREIPRDWRNDVVDSGGKTLWNANLVLDRRMTKDKVVLRCENILGTKTVKRVRSRNFSVRRTVRLAAELERKAEAARAKFERGK